MRKVRINAMYRAWLEPYFSGKHWECVIGIFRKLLLQMYNKFSALSMSVCAVYSVVLQLASAAQIDMKILCFLFIICFGIGAYTRNTPIPRISNGYLVDLATAPWHTGLYRKVRRPYTQICGGTIIAKQVVITAAHCVTIDRLILPTWQFAVAAGKKFRRWDDYHDVEAQKSNVQAIKVPPRYQGVVTNFQHDIALLMLTDEFTFTDRIKPACLNFDTEFDKEQLQEGQWGKVVGWGLTGRNSQPSNILRGAALPYITIDKCIEQSPAGFRSFITGDKICAGFNNGTAVCRGDSGGGLVFPHTLYGIERYFLRGIVSTSPISKHACNIHTWATFTHLLQHEHFVRSYVPNVEEACDTFEDIMKTRFGRSIRRSRHYKCACTYY